MAINYNVIPNVEDGGSMGIVGSDSGLVYDAITRDRLDAMETWTFQESLQVRDRRLTHLGVTEPLGLVALPAETTAAFIRLLEDNDRRRR